MYTTIEMVDAILVALEQCLGRVNEMLAQLRMSCTSCSVLGFAALGSTKLAQVRTRPLPEPCDDNTQMERISDDGGQQVRICKIHPSVAKEAFQFQLEAQHQEETLA